MHELRSRITYSEFLEWVAFLNLEEERNSKQDYYLAQIAAEMRRSQVRTPRKIKVTDFLIQRKVTEDPKAKMKVSKAAWSSLLRLKIED